MLTVDEILSAMRLREMLPPRHSGGACFGVTDPDRLRPPSPDAPRRLDRRPEEDRAPKPLPPRKEEP